MNKPLSRRRPRWRSFEEELLLWEELNEQDNEIYLYYFDCDEVERFLHPRRPYTYPCEDMLRKL